MSGSFYSLDTKYNSLLALLADLGITAATINNLNEVLTEGNDAGNHTITNLLVRNNALVGGTKNVYYNETTGELGQASAVFPTIDLDYVLQEGNDANNQSIINLNSISFSNGAILNTLRSNGVVGGTKNVYYNETTKELGYAASVFPTIDLDYVPQEGNDANNQSIINLNSISFSNGAILNTLRDNGFVGGTKNVYYNETTKELGYAASVFPTIDLDYVLQEGNDANSQSITNLSGVQLSSGGITFPDATIQTTAFTAGGSFTNPYPDDITMNGVRVGRGVLSQVTNTIVGTGCLSNDTGGSYNSTAMGYLAGEYAQTARDSTFFGFRAGNLTTTGEYNTAIGSDALRNTNIGFQNTAVGASALRDNISGNNNTAVGTYALIANTASENTAVGYVASNSNTTGSANTAIGFEALKTNTIGINNTAVGWKSLRLTDPLSGVGNNTGVGIETLQLNTTGQNNTAIGSRCCSNNTTGTGNTALGINALNNNQTGEYNIGIGFLGGYYNGSADDYNISIGFVSGFNSGSNNIVLGKNTLGGTKSGSNNIIIGNNNTIATGGSTTSNDNIYIGNDTGQPFLGKTNSVAIGNGAEITDSNGIFLGGPTNTFVVVRGLVQATAGIKAGIGYYCLQGTGGGIYGNIFNTWWTGSTLQFWIDSTNVYSVSDYRIKENITEPQPVLDRLCAVKMIEYEYKEEGIFKKGGRMLGVLAHELQEAFPELESVVTGEKDDVDEKGNNKLQNLHEKHTMLYMKAIQELNAKVEAQQKQIDQLIALLAK